MSTFAHIVSQLNEKEPVSRRIRAIFGLKALHTNDTVQALERSLRSDPSALVRHEIAYVLGQMREKSAIPTLETTLNDVDEDVMVRHEAAEALGAIGDPSTLPILETYTHNPQVPPELRETCELAVDKIRHEQNSKTKADDQDGTKEPAYPTVDPVTPTAAHNSKTVSELCAELCDHNNSLVTRYSAMFALRNRGGDDAVRALCSAIESDEHSALFRHEVAYVLGQMASPVAVPALTRVLQRPDESHMVRHEAAEALGAIGGQDVDSILETFVTDAEEVVRESVYVALDISDYITSDKLEYTETDNAAQS